MGASLAALHDQLVEGGVEWDRVLAREACHAEGVFLQTGRSHHAINIEVTDAVGTQIVADLLVGVLVGNEFLWIGKVDAVVAGVLVWRAADAQVDLLGSGLTKVHHAGLGGGAAHDGVIDDDNTFSLHGLADEVELHPHIEVTDELRWLDEGTPDVVVADKGGVIRNPELFGEAERGVDARVGYRDHDIGLDRVESCQFPAHIDASLADGHAAQAAVRAREIDVLKDTKGLSAFGKGKLRADPLVIDHNDLARLDIANEGGTDQVEGASLGGEDPTIIQLAERERPEAARIAHADDFLLTHHHHGECSSQLAERADRTAHRVVGLGQKMQDDLAVDRGLEDRATHLQFRAKGGCVDEVSVVGDRDLAARGVDHEGL